jgi:hypothetical protein
MPETYREGESPDSSEPHVWKFQNQFNLFRPLNKRLAELSNEDGARPVLSRARHSPCVQSGASLALCSVGRVVRPVFSRTRRSPFVQSGVSFVLYSVGRVARFAYSRTRRSPFVQSGASLAICSVGRDAFEPRKSSVYVLCLILPILLGIFKLYDVSEAEPASVIRCKRAKYPTQFGPLERASLDHRPPSEAHPAPDVHKAWGSVPENGAPDSPLRVEIASRCSCKVVMSLCPRETTPLSLYGFC